MILLPVIVNFYSDITMYLGLLAVLYVDTRNARSYRAEQLVFDSADLFRGCLDGAPSLVSVGIYRHDIADLYAGYLGNVDKRLIHAYPAADRCGRSVDIHHPVARNCCGR